MKTLLWWKLLLFSTLLQLVFTIGVALGADAAVIGEVVSNAQAQNAFGQFAQNVIRGEWWPALGPALVCVVWAVKKWDQDIPKVGPAISKFMDNPVVSYLTPFVLSMGAGLGTSLGAGIPIKEALPAVFKIAMEAVVLYVGGKKLIEQKAAGAAAVAVVADGGKAAAIEELKKP